MCALNELYNWVNEGSLFMVSILMVLISRGQHLTLQAVFTTHKHVLVVVVESWRRVPCEQPLHMGQSILRPREVPLWAAVWACLVRVCAPWSKGNRGQYSRTWKRSSPPLDSQSCEAMEPPDTGWRIGKSCLCLQGTGLPETDWIGDRYRGPVERCIWSSIRCLAGPWKSGGRV